MKFPKKTSKIKVAVLFGGKSTEHDISIITATQAMENFDTSKYQIIPIYISKNNEMFYNPDFKNIKSFPLSQNIIKKSLRISFIKEDEKTFVIGHNKHSLFAQKYEIDVAFPIVHGTNVEDGNLCGFLHSVDLPVVGCDTESSAICMDKYASKYLLDNIKIPVLPAVKLSKNDSYNHKDIIHKIHFPMIVKPNNLGSSIGISKVTNQGELENAIKNAFTFSDIVIIEKAVEPLREINCAVLGDFLDSKNVITSKLEEPIVKDSILSYENKYTDGGKKTGVKNSTKSSSGMASASRKFPAEIPETLSKKIQECAKLAFIELKCSGVVRIDFLLDENNNIYLNEINTIPGSLSYYLWDFSFAELISKLINISLSRYRHLENKLFTFNSSVLPNKN